jgi:hypothetical protein
MSVPKHRDICQTKSHVFVKSGNELVQSQRVDEQMERKTYKLWLIKTAVGVPVHYAGSGDLTGRHGDAELVPNPG